MDSPTPDALLEAHDARTFAAPRMAGALRMFTVAEAMALPPRHYLLPGLMAPGELSAWWGAPKCGKTFLVMRLAYGLALGEGMWERHPPRPIRVLYGAAEGEGGIGSRLAALHELLGDPGDALAVIAQRMQLGPPGQHLEDFIAAARMHRAELVVVDTLARTFGEGDEDRAQDMGGFIASLDRLREEGRQRGDPMPHVAVIHHGSKDPQAKTPRGSGALLGAADLVVRIARSTENSPAMATVEHAKDDADGAELPFRLRVVDVPTRGGATRRTCIAEESSPPAAAPANRVPLTESQRGWLRDIADVLGQEGLAIDRVPVPGMAPIPCVTRDEIRDGLRRRGRLGDATGDAKLTGAERTALYKMLNALKDKGKLGLTDQFVWLT